MTLLRTRVRWCRDGEISNENLVNESRVVELRWVGERKRRERGFDEIWMDVFRLITSFESEILEERICGERSREKTLWEKL